MIVNRKLTTYINIEIEINNLSECQNRIIQILKIDNQKKSKKIFKKMSKKNFEKNS